MKSQHMLPFLAIFFASVIWGATPPIMKIALYSVPIFSLAFLRFGIAALLFFPFVYKHLNIAKKDIPLVIFSAFFGITFNIAFFFWGLTLTTALNAGVIVASSPIFTLLFAKTILKEVVTKKILLGSIIGLLGIFSIIAKDAFHTGVTISPLGDLLLLVSTISFVLYEMVSKKLFQRYHPSTITFLSFLIGALSFIPAAFFELYKDPSWANELPFPAFMAILYGIVFSSLAAYTLWSWGLSKIDAARVGSFFYLEPVVSTIVAVMLLSETITPTFLIGSLLVATGLIIAEGHLPYHHFRKIK